MNSENPSGEMPKGKILRLKTGYNPNSSSIGTMVFAIPVAMLSAAVAFGAASGVIFSAFAKKNGEAESTENNLNGPSDKG